MSNIYFPFDPDLLDKDTAEYERAVREGFVSYTGRTITVSEDLLRRLLTPLDDCYWEPAQYEAEALLTQQLYEQAKEVEENEASTA